MKRQLKMPPPARERLFEDELISWQDFQSHIGRYAFAAQFVKDKAILDVACGAGYGSSYLMSKGAKKVIGGDISKEAIEYANAHHKKDNLSFLTFDAHELPFADNSFDVIVSVETIEHIQDQEGFLAECRRVLKDAGTFICSTPNKEVTSPNSEKPLNPYHLKEYYIEDFEQLLSRYFKNVVLSGYIRYRDSGIKQKLIGGIESLVGSLPEILQTLVIKIVMAVTTVIFHEYHPIFFEDIDERDFDEIVTDDFRPFPIQDTQPVYIFAVGTR